MREEEKKKVPQAVKEYARAISTRPDFSYIDPGKSSRLQIAGDVVIMIIRGIFIVALLVQRNRTHYTYERAGSFVRL